MLELITYIFIEKKLISYSRFFIGVDRLMDDRTPL